MHRNEDDDHRNDQRLQNGFNRMEGEGCPRRCDDAVVMNVVEKLENLGVMHPTM